MRETPRRQADRTAREAAERAAARADLGSHVESHAIREGVGTLSLVSMSLVPALLSAGIGLRAGPYGPAVRAVATGLLVLAALGSVVALWAELRRTRRRRRAHLFERGLVVTGPEPPLACAWHDVRVIERRQTVGDPRTGRYTQRWMVLSTRGGDRLSAPGDARFLCKLKATSPAAASVHRAMRGSAGA